MPGKIVQALAQVRITLRSFVRLRVSIFACSLASINGPFFDDLTILNLRDLSGVEPVTSHPISTDHDSPDGDERSCYPCACYCASAGRQACPTWFWAGHRSVPCPHHHRADGRGGS